MRHFADQGQMLLAYIRQAIAQQTLNRRLVGLFCLGLLGGALGVFAFAPFSFWPAFAITVFVFTWLTLRASSGKQAWWLGFAVGLGYFGAGVSWVYVSIATYGQVGALVSFIITLGFVALLAAFYALAATISWRLFVNRPYLSKALVISISLLFTEYLRSQVFTGFPWLLPGYAMQHSYLFEFSAIGGIWLLSFVSLLSFTLAISLFCSHNKRFDALLLIITLAIWGSAWQLTLTPPKWVTIDATLKTTLVQGNVSQDEKWLAEQAAPTLEYYQQTTLDNLGSDLVVWPETAITYLYHQAKPYLDDFNQTLAEQHTTLITGIPYWDKTKNTYYNAVWASGDGFGLYFKQRLVPFGEYIPFQEIVGKLLDLFGMPMSMFSRGDSNQPVLQVGNWGAAPFICYEIVYPEQVRKLVRDSDFLVTISNDGWFGNSIGPLQHLQIAQFRAKESGRYLIRATNTGVSAVINEQGQITAALPQFIRTSLTTSVGIASGITPYVQYGNLVCISLLLLLICGQYLYSLGRLTK